MEASIYRRPHGASRTTSHGIAKVKRALHNPHGGCYESGCVSDVIRAKTTPSGMAYLTPFPPGATGSERMDIIVHDPGPYHPSLDDVKEFEDAVRLDPNVVPIDSSTTIFSRIPNLVWRNLYRLMALVPRAKPKPKPGPIKHRFVILMGPRFRKTMPFFLADGCKSAYIFDAWPQNQERYRLFADACQLDHLFVSSSQGAATLAGMMRSTACHWIPEAVSPSDYFLPSHPERDIDVLQLGRRFNTYHRMINDDLVRRSKVYVYEKEPGQIIFPTRQSLIEGLLRAKISICAPMAMTHPEKAGGIETMTMRYLQSMLSKCLVVGHAPAEMIQVFGYNPVVEIDFSNAGPQLLEILDNFADYQPLIEKNYQMVCQHHTWQKRWQQIAGILHGHATGARPAASATAKSK